MNKQLITDLAELLGKSGEGSEKDSTGDDRLARLLVEQTSAWAVGLWKVDGNNLSQVLCAFEEGFPEQVASEFREQTKQVSLAHTQLGIVNAVVNNRAALALASEQQGELAKSAGWLNRFGARCSLSCPIADSSVTTQAVIAVSWKELYEQSDAVPQKLLSIAKFVGESLQNRS